MDKAILEIQHVNPKPAEFLKRNNPPSIFGTVHYHLRNIKMKTSSWSANGIEPGQTAQTCRLAWLYTGGNGYNHFWFWQVKIEIS